jgi:hypothetical protein
MSFTAQVKRLRMGGAIVYSPYIHLHGVDRENITFIVLFSMFVKYDSFFMPFGIHIFMYGYFKDAGHNSDWVYMAFSGRIITGALEMEVHKTVMA